MKNRIIKIEKYLSVNTNWLGFIFLILILLIYELNNENIKNIYQVYSNSLIQDIRDMEVKVKDIESLNRLLIKNTYLIDEEIPFLSEFIKNKKGKKVIAISSKNESISARIKMNGILKSIKNKNNKVGLFYISDYKFKEPKIPDLNYFIADSTFINNSNLITPVILIFSANNKVLAAFNIYDAINKNAIELILNTTNIILSKNNILLQD